MKFKNWLNEGVLNPASWFSKTHPAENPIPTVGRTTDNWVFGEKSQADFNSYKSSHNSRDPFFKYDDMSRVLGYKVGPNNENEATRQGNGYALVKVDPCILMKKFFTQGLPGLTSGAYNVNKYHGTWSQPTDPGLPLIKIIDKKVSIDEGNHRLMSACQEGMHSAVVYIRFFGNYDVLKPAVISVMKEFGGYSRSGRL